MKGNLHVFMQDSADDDAGLRFSIEDDVAAVLRPHPADNR
jgi:hypothetical protein